MFRQFSKAATSAKKAALAAAEVLFGDVNPGGKLPITFPHSVGDAARLLQPQAERQSQLRVQHPQAAVAFGYGLSYTSFKFDNLRVEPAQMLPGGTAKVSVDVTNSGGREGDEVPQLYIHPKVSSVTQPVMRLAGFERIALKPGEKKTVEFTMTPEMLSILNIDMHRVVEPGALCSRRSSSRASSRLRRTARSRDRTARSGSAGSAGA